MNQTIKDLLWMLGFTPALMVLYDNPDDILPNIVGAVYGALYILYAIHRDTLAKRSSKP